MSSLCYIVICRQWCGGKCLKIGSADTIVTVVFHMVFHVGHGIVDWHARHNGLALLTTSLKITRKFTNRLLQISSSIPLNIGICILVELFSWNRIICAVTGCRGDLCAWNDSSTALA